jgi:hypothetical protein
MKNMAAAALLLAACLQQGAQSFVAVSPAGVMQTRLAAASASLSTANASDCVVQSEGRRRLLCSQPVALATAVALLLQPISPATAEGEAYCAMPLHTSTCGWAAHTCARTTGAADAARRCYTNLSACTSTVQQACDAPALATAAASLPHVHTPTVRRPPRHR